MNESNETQSSIELRRGDGNKKMNNIKFNSRDIEYLPRHNEPDFHIIFDTYINLYVYTKI